jgi:hypothetical protein
MLKSIRVATVILPLIGLVSCAPFHHTHDPSEDRSGKLIDLTINTKAAII